MQEIKIRIPKELNDKLKKASKKKFDYVNVSMFIRQLLIKYFK